MPDLIAHLHKRIGQYFSFNRKIGLFKNFPFDNLHFLFKRIHYIEGYSPVFNIIPNLKRIYPHVFFIIWRIKIKTLMFPDYFIPVSCININIASWPDKKIHFMQGINHFFIRNIGQRIAGTHYTIIFFICIFVNPAKIRWKQFHRHPFFLCFLSAFIQHDRI